MNTRTHLVSAGLLAVICGGAHSQPPGAPALPGFPGISPIAAPPPKTPGDKLQRLRDVTIPSPVVPIPAAPGLAVPVAPPEKTVDDLLNELERIQSQKSELAKKEQELKAMLQKKLDAQAERLKKLGATPTEPEPDRVLRIIIEGNTKTPDGKIREQLGFFTGQILKYPALEEARVKLEKAGFLEVTVEVVPNEPDSSFKDIRVRVTEPESDR